MHLRLISAALIFVATSFTVSCSDDSTPSFDDPLAAMDYAESSMAENKFEHAEAAYGYVIANGDSSLTADCLQGIYSAQTRAGQEERAIATFERICRERPEALGGEPMLDLLQDAITSKMADLAEEIMIYTYRNHFELATKLILPSVDIATIRLESSLDPAALAELGYVSGDGSVEIPEDQLEGRLKQLDDFICILEQQRGLTTTAPVVE
ncbi:MAG: hypothetical protein GY747_12855 [Planctomycetes bacterium]|nr:hypothetical protein [Planctomycetota bacterium]MCP4770567.1 hypothetical protein [Planctomycetota bacterium]MCP4860342.1 hypothetical protein [Planctomycetota bacterium]